MGLKHNSGLPDRLLLNSTSNCITSLSTILCRAESSDFRGGNRITTEGCNKGSSTGRANRFLFEPLSCPEEGWRATLSNQSQSPQQLCEQRKFQNGGHSHSERSPEREDWLAKIEFMFQGKTYQFNCLPFSLSSGPWVFTKTLKSALAILWERGVRLIAYIDDLLLLGESKDLILDQVTGVRYLLECQGFNFEYQEINTGPSTGNKIPGSVCGLTRNGNQAFPS